MPGDLGQEPTESDHIRPSNHRRANTEIIPPHSSSCTLPSAGSSALGDSTEEDRTQQNLYERYTRRKFDTSGKFLPDWFQGRSESSTLGGSSSPTKERPSAMDSAPEATMTNTQPDNASIISTLSTQSTTSRFQKRMTAPSALSRFPWWSSKPQEPPKPALPEPADDEFLNLDIPGALFPAGSGKEYSQEAFEALQANAEKILRRLQAAYKQRTFALHEVMAEKTALQEELAEARTRVQHVKMQLDGMAEKVVEKEKANKALTDELEKERQARREAEEALKRSVVLAPSRNNDSFSDIVDTPRRHVKRSSSSTLTSDSGFESGDESPAESVFSRRIEYPGSPLSTFSTPACSTSPEATLPPITTTSQPAPKAPAPAPQPQPRLSAYDRVIKGLSSTLGGASKCSNCHGVRASEAWSVVGVLKEENKGLKSRIGDLESVIDDCLSLVG
ncbi:hypothetical protein VTN77DRAFT_2903 [Rasamsonia byssochlamydoides]|uniref:uncharacterized protein n=1 Tax=Rasamsonia byssochlamydoides TaxID=89139 RepID=UPI0037435E93